MPTSDWLRRFMGASLLASWAMMAVALVQVQRAKCDEPSTTDLVQAERIKALEHKAVKLEDARIEERLAVIELKLTGLNTMLLSVLGGVLMLVTETMTRILRIRKGEEK